MTEKSILIDEYRIYTGREPDKVILLPKSGSGRQYYRFTSGKESIIGVFNPNREENDTFIGFTSHFKSKGLPVPETLHHRLDQNIYFLKDLGDTTLFSWIMKRNPQARYDDDTNNLYKLILDWLIRFQVEGVDDFDTSLCYPHRSFDRQSMIWDMNYFKYMFLKLVSVNFNEKRLEKDFVRLSDFLFEAGQDYFLYRDFQSANIMLVDNLPWFIDYQGGRLGAAQYDLASLLYDSKAYIPPQNRETLIEYYIGELRKYSSINTSQFRKYLPGFIIIRLLQALGAFGYRGLYEQKPGFAQSILPALKDLKELVLSGRLDFELPELSRIVEEISEGDRFHVLNEPENLTITINSFSYMSGLPVDWVHGGGFIFDCRCLENPEKLPEYSDISQLDHNVDLFFEDNSLNISFINDAIKMIERSIESYKRKNYSSLTVSFGSTGGQHRSVYCSEKMAAYLREIGGVEVLVKHRDIRL